MSEQQRGTLGLAAVAAAAVGLLGFAVGATAGARAARREKEEQAPKLLSVNSSQSQRQSSLPAPSAAASLDLWTSMSWGDERKVGKEEGGLAVASTAKTRIESDLLGELQIPADSYFGIQTLRAASNYQITGIPLSHFPDFIAALALVKKSCALANGKVGSLEPRLVTAITATCDEIVGGALHPEFIVDMVQGGAGTSTNMNANEVIANRALELLGQEKGSYEHCHPNDHVNKSQSTNDAYPTACKLAILLKQRALCEKMEALVASLRRKGREFAGVLKMGRTQLQDAVPMTPVVLPFTLVPAAIGTSEATAPAPSIAAPLADVAGTVCLRVHAMAVAHAILPLAFEVLVRLALARRCEVVGPASVELALAEFALEQHLVLRAGDDAEAVLDALGPLALVHPPIRQHARAPAMA